MAGITERPVIPAFRGHVPQRISDTLYFYLVSPISCAQDGWYHREAGDTSFLASDFCKRPTRHHELDDKECCGQQRLATPGAPTSVGDLVFSSRTAQVDLEIPSAFLCRYGDATMRCA